MAGDWNFPGSQKAARRGQSCFDEFAPSVLQRWKEGEHRGIMLYREIKEQGYTGSVPTVYRYVDVLKQAEVETSANLHRLHQFSANAAVWLFVRDPKTLDDIEREDLAAFCQVSSTLKRAYELIQDFLRMVHKKEGARLDAWLEKITQSGIAELQSFAHGVERDKEAVRVGLTSSINNGMVEGHVTKLKLIKRTMYGRAGFPLLRQRVLHALSPDGQTLAFEGVFALIFAQFKKVTGEFKIEEAKKESERELQRLLGKPSTVPMSSSPHPPLSMSAPTAPLPGHAHASSRIERASYRDPVGEQVVITTSTKCSYLGIIEVTRRQFQEAGTTCVECPTCGARRTLKSPKDRPHFPSHPRRLNPPPKGERRWREQEHIWKLVED